MTSSLRNSIHRRNHKERSQPAHRSKFGILEKHSDYVKRAQDYHSKQNRLLRLRQKAAERNKDEFYFAMRNEKTKAGVHIKDRGNVALPTDIVKVLKTQDENYIRTVRAAGLKKIDKLKNQLTSLADLIKPHGDNDLGDEELQILNEAGILSGTAHAKGRRKAKHIVFIDSNEEAQKHLTADDQSLIKVDNDIAVETDEIAFGWKTTDKGKKPVRHVALTKIAGDEDNDNVDQGTSRRRLLKELAARLARDKQLRYAERELEMQRLMMGKGGRIKLRGAEKEGDSEDEDEDEDEIDARKGKRRVQKTKVDEKAYKPRVYKWRLERKR